MYVQGHRRLKSGRGLRLLIVALLLTGMPLVACRGGRTESATVGVIILIPAMEPALDGIKRGLAEQGFVEGENVEFLFDGALGSLEEVERTAQRYVEAGVDAIISVSTPPTQIVQRVTAGTSIPVVFGATDPVGAGLVNSLARPGGNLTGVATGLAEDVRLEWLLRVAPGVQRVYVPYNPSDLSAIFALGMVDEAATRLGVELVSVRVTTTEEVEAAIRDIPPDVDGIFLLPDSLVASASEGWIQAALARRLPMSGASSPPQKGVLVSYAFNLADAGRQVGRILARVLQGEDPADLSVEAVAFSSAINLQTAEAIGIEIPGEILQQADVVIR
jgi:putative ABC transport system substrate-binding protein